MSKLAQTVSSLLRLKKAVSYTHMIKAAQKEFSLQALKVPESKKVLIFAPHPDDDVFGMGGTIADLVDNKCEVKIIYLTDGSKGTISGIRDKRLVAIRKRESEKALKLLGITDLTFWGYADGNLPANKSTLKATETLIETFSPDIICLPSMFDDHVDHRQTNEIVTKVLENKGLLDMEIWGYEVWTSGFYNRINDVSRKADVKYRAGASFESQLKCRDYLSAIQGLDVYRAKVNGLGDYAEGFITCPADLYISLYKKAI